MVTKGHDFPNVTLVVVLNADHGLFSTDFRAPERLAQTIVQVAGRAGRGEQPGEVLIQTEFPDHPLLRSLLAEGYDGFARTALIEREAGALAALQPSRRGARFGQERRGGARVSDGGAASGTPARARAAVRTRAGRHGQARRPLPRATSHRERRPQRAASLS